MTRIIEVLVFGWMFSSFVGASSPQIEQKGMILIHVTQGPENPTRAALAFLVAKTAIDEGPLRCFLQAVQSS